MSGLAVTPILVREVGASAIGSWLGTGQIIGIIGIFDFGMSILFVREVAALSGQVASAKRDAGFGAIIGNFTLVSLIQLPVLLGGCGIAWILLPAEMQRHTGICFFVLGVLVCTFFLKYLTNVLMGLQDQIQVARFQLVAWTISTSITYLLATNGYGIKSLAIGWAVAELVVPLCAGFRIWSQFPFVFRAVHFNLGKIPFRSYWEKGKWLMIGNFTHILTSSNDLTIIGKVAGPTQVSVYSMTNKLFGIASNLPNQIVGVATPTMFQIVSEDRKKNFLRIFSGIVQITLILSGFLVAAILSVNSQFIPWWVGGEFYGGNALTIALGINLIIRQLAACSAFGCLWLGYHRDSVVAPLLAGIFTVLLAIPLTKYAGSLGTVWASTATIILVSLPWSLYRLCLALDVSLAEVMQPHLAWAWRTLFVLIVSFGFSMVPSQFGLFGMIAKALFVTILYLFMMKPILFGSLLGEYVIPRFKKISFWKKLSSTVSDLNPDVAVKSGKANAGN